MTTKHIINCPCCYKIFKKKGCYEKHILRCERTDRELGGVSGGVGGGLGGGVGGGHNNGPSNRQLYEMIQTITEKYNQVQSELESLKRQINVKNKKLDVISWLNENSEPDKNIDFIEVFQSIYIDQCQLDVIFEKGLIDGMFETIKNHVQIKQEQTQKNFMKCFQQKKNIIYVCREGIWQMLTIDDFSKMIDELNVKIFAAFNQYRVENIDKLDQDEFQITFTNNLNKLLCSNISFDQRCIRIKNKLFVEFNECFKNIVEYQIE